MTRNNSILGIIILSISSVTLAVIAVEIFLRVIATDEYYVRSPGTKKVFHPDNKIMPGIEGVSNYVINKDGFRADEITNSYKYRILAIGGSTTECLYLDEPESWPKLVQKKLNKLSTENTQVWVGNVGVSGHSTRNHIVQADKLTDQFSNIDVILLLVGANDLLLRLELDNEYSPLISLKNLSTEGYEDLMNKSFAIRPGSDSAYTFIKRTEIWRKLRLVKNRYLFPPTAEIVQDTTGKVYEKWRKHRKEALLLRDTLPDLASALEEYSRNIKNIINDAKRKKVHIVLITQPTIWNEELSQKELDLLWMGQVGDFMNINGNTYYSASALAEGMDKYNSLLLNICKENNIDCIDLESQMPKNTSIFYDDMHYTEYGSEKVATIVSEYLYSNLIQSEDN